MININGMTEKEFSETRREVSKGIDTISINSDINVTVSDADTDFIEVFAYGTVFHDNEIELSVSRLEGEMQISLKKNPSINLINVNNQIVINNFNGANNLALEVKIPMKVNKLSIITKNGNIDIKSTVRAKNITVDSKNGNIDLSATFKELNIRCRNGNIDVDSEAKSDVSLDIMTKNGNINVYLENIGTSEVSVHSSNRCKNTPRLKGVYTAFGYIHSKNGNIRFAS